MSGPDRPEPDLLPPLARWKAEGAVLPDLALTPHMARRDTAPCPPSFAAAMDAAVRQARIATDILKQDPASRLLRRRVWVGDWLEARGHPVPRLLAGPFPLQDILRHLEGIDRGVIKPVQATNAWGVMPFHRTGPFEIRSLFDGQSYRMGALLEALHAPMQRFMFPNRWQVEELLTPPGHDDRVPDDFKAYGFGGAVPLILQVRRTDQGNRYKFYDADWQPVETGKYPEDTDMDLPPPQDPQALMALAKAISADLPIPFCRIDLYETSHGPVVGELTPEPGGYQNFDAACDAALGLWHDRAQALLALRQAAPDPSSDPTEG
jgi:hypothetical protein